jgi:predicted dehydrogenase
MVNVVFVGCGAALEHLYQAPLKALEKRGWLKVAALVDPAEKRRTAALGWFPDGKAFPDMREAFQVVEDLDLAIIASPPAYHAEHAATAFELDCHVLCEKPLAHSVAAAEQMVRAAEKTSSIFAVGMMRRFYPAVELARDWVKHQVGPCRFVYREGSIFDWPVASPSQFRRETGGGGVLIDKGVHALDILYHIFGQGRVLRSADDASGGSGVEANAALELAFGETSGLLQVSWETPLNNGFHIFGPKEELWMPLTPIDVVWTRPRGSKSDWARCGATSGWPDDLVRGKSRTFKPDNFLDCIRMQLISVLRSIHLGERPMASGQEGLDVLRLLMAAYDQATPLNQRWLPQSEQQTTVASHWRASDETTASRQLVGKP